MHVPTRELSEVLLGSPAPQTPPTVAYLTQNEKFKNIQAQREARHSFYRKVCTKVLKISEYILSI